jgi:hypothetical protein
MGHVWRTRMLTAGATYLRLARQGRGHTAANATRSLCRTWICGFNAEPP